MTGKGYNRKSKCEIGIADESCSTLVSYERCVHAYSRGMERKRLRSYEKK